MCLQTKTGDPGIKFRQRRKGAIIYLALNKHVTTYLFKTIALVHKNYLIKQ
ncbi:hypothetical protein SAMN05216524_102386 [Mucilaginibacter sp. OK098]|nr:hypothetical protein SAMN05216524_102386 [Mucilaginibacter sp. OK098]